jgi:hypothetical protein
MWGVYVCAYVGCVCGKNAGKGKEKRKGSWEGGTSDLTRNRVRKLSIFYDKIIKRKKRKKETSK